VFAEARGVKAPRAAPVGRSIFVNNNRWGPGKESRGGTSEQRGKQEPFRGECTGTEEHPCKTGGERGEEGTRGKGKKKVFYRKTGNWIWTFGNRNKDGDRTTQRGIENRKSLVQVGPPREANK